MAGKAMLAFPDHSSDILPLQMKTESALTENTFSIEARTMEPRYCTFCKGISGVRRQKRACACRMAGKIKWNLPPHLAEAGRPESG